MKNFLNESGSESKYYDKIDEMDEYEMDEIEESDIKTYFIQSICTCDVCTTLNEILPIWNTWKPSPEMETSIKKIYRTCI